MLVHFRNVVDKVSDFENATGSLEKDEINGIEYTPRQVIQQYKNAALHADGRTCPCSIIPGVPSTPSEALQRLSVNIHDSYADLESGSLSMDNAFSSILDDMYDGTYDINVTNRGGNGTTRLPNKLWNMLTNWTKNSIYNQLEICNFIIWVSNVRLTMIIFLISQTF